MHRRGRVRIIVGTCKTGNKIEFPIETDEPDDKLFILAWAFFQDDVKKPPKVTVLDANQKFLKDVAGKKLAYTPAKDGRHDVVVLSARLGSLPDLRQTPIAAVPEAFSYHIISLQARP
jgi:hypothetical protein